MSYGVFIASIIVALVSWLAWLVHASYSKKPPGAYENVEGIFGSIFYFIVFLGTGFTAVVLLVVSGIMKLFGN